MAIKIDHQQNLLKTQTNELKLDITGSLTLPSGATSDRSGSPNTGDIRFNTTTTRFEGYTGSAWKTFTTIMQDIDKDTYVTVEDSDGTDNDQIDFFTAGSQRMVIHSDGNIGINQAAPTKLLDVGGSFKATGDATLDSTLLVGGIADFDARVDINDGTTSSSTSTGALVVSGGAGIGGALNVGGDMNVGGTVTMSGNFQVSGTQTQLVSTSINQALIKLGEGTTTQSVDQGFIVTRGDGVSTNTNNVGAIYDESEDEVAFISCPTEDGQTSGNVNIVDYIKVHLGELEAEDNLTVKGITSLTGNLTSQGTATFTEMTVGDLNNQKFIIAGASGRLTTDNAILFDGTNVKFDTNGALQIPGGSTAQRPGTPTVGMIRYNTNDLEFEGYIGGAWNRLSATNFLELTDTPASFDPGKFLRVNAGGTEIEFVDSAADVVDDLSPQLGGNLDMNGKDITGKGNININSDDDTNAVGPSITLDRQSATPSGGDGIGVIKFDAYNSAGTPATKTYAQIYGYLRDITATNEDGAIRISVLKDSVNTIVAEFDREGVRIGKDADLIFEGSTDDGNETKLTATDPGQDNTITLPDASGTVMLNVVEDTTPQLGGALDLNDKDITIATNGQSDIGTGSNQIGTLYAQNIGSQANQVGTVFTNNITMHNAYHSHASTATSSSTAEFNVDQWPIATYRSAKYFISCENTTSSIYQITQILVLHDGSNVYMTTYGSLLSGANQFTISADINGGNVRLRLTPANTNNMNYRFIAEKHLI